ncbi:MAG: CoA transferase [Kangiellaceae bacterium]|nr:CoA transferase [Kangiellaceae bacterium]
MSLLEGIKVIDLSRILAGPWATQLLADYGAEVIKIEKPEVGDDTRNWGPPFVNLDGEQVAAYFAGANRGKASISLDITSAAGQSQIKDMVKNSDVLVENFKVGGLAKYGLDYTSLKSINPRLIYCSISGFGQTGPLKNEPGYDAMIQAMGGLMSITGQPDEKGGEPTKVGVAVADLMTGMYASNAIMAAIIYRNKTGEGQHIDVSLFECQLAMLANQGMNVLAGDEAVGRLGNAHPNIVPYQTFETSSGHIMIAVGNDAQFKKLCIIVGLEQLALDPRFRSNSLRVEHRDILIALLQNRLHLKTNEYWLTRLKQQSIPCSQVNSIKQALNNEQSVARNIVKRFNLKEGELSYISHPVKFSKVQLDDSRPPPNLKN